MGTLTPETTITRTTFKVVFNKARGALMVVNEVTSSVQGKGTKTVVAAAVATMMAGVAGTAIAEVAGTAYVGEGASIVTEIKGGAVKVTNDKVKASKDAEGTLATDGSYNHTSVITLEGGLIKLVGSEGTSAIASIEQNFKSIEGNGTLELSSKAGQYAGPTTINIAEKLTLTSGNINFLANDTAATDETFGAQSVTAASDVALGEVAVFDGNPSTVNVSVAKDINALVKGANVTLNSVAVENAGELTFEGTTSVVLKGIDLAKNTGKVIFKGATTANEAFVNGGKTVFTGNTVFEKGFEGTTVLLKSADLVNTDTQATVFKDDVTVKDGIFKADALTLNAAAKTFKLDSEGSSAANPAPKFNVTTVDVKAGTLKLNGESTIGTLDVKSGLSSTLAGKTTIENLNVSTANNATAGTELAANSGELTVTKSVTVNGLNDQEATLEVKGKTSLANVALQNKAVLSTEGTFTADTIKMTKASDQNGIPSLTFTAGTANVKTLDVQVGGVTNTAALTADAIKLTKGTTFEQTGGSLKLGTLTLDAEAADDSFKVSSGTLTTAGANILTYDATKTTWAEKLKKVQGVNVTGANLELTDAVDYTINSFTEVKNATVGQSTGSLAFTEGLIHGVDADGKMDLSKKVKFEEVKALNGTGSDKILNLGKSAVTVTLSAANAETKLENESQVVLGSVQMIADTGVAADAVYTSGFSLGKAGADALTLRGDKDGQVFIGFNTKDANGKVSPAKVTFNNDVTLGLTAEDKGTIDNAIIVSNGTNAKTLTVKGDFTVNNDITFNSNGSRLDVTGTLTANNLKFGKQANGQNVTSADLNVTGGTVVLAGDYLRNEGVRDTKDLSRHVSTAGLKLNAVETETEQRGSLLVIGTANVEAAQAYQSAHHLDNTVWIGEQTTFDGTAPQFGTPVYNGIWNGLEASGESTIALDIASIKANGYKAAATMAETSAIVTATTTIGGVEKLHIANFKEIDHSMLVLNKDGAYQMNVGNLALSTTGSGIVIGRVDLGNPFINGSLTDNILTFTPDEIVLNKVSELGLNTFGAVDHAVRNIQFGQNAFADKIIFGLDDYILNNSLAMFDAAKAAGLLQETTTEEELVAQRSYFVENYDADDQNRLTGLVAEGKLKDFVKFVSAYEDAAAKKLVNEENTATNLAVAGGAFNAALDVNDQVTAALDRRTSLANLNTPRTEGFTPWVDVFGTANENEAYEADIYGAVLGFDYTASCGGVFGAAFNVGTADSNSANNATKVDNDSDFYGFSIYGAQTFGDFNVKADFGYTKLKNELSANTAFFGAVSEKLDSDVLTFGLGAEYLVKFGQLNVVPHAGFRVSRLSMDDSQYGASYDDMTVYQMPMGVAFSGTFETNGWQLAPMVDLTVVPAFGDKNAIATYFGGIEQSTRVVDTNPIQVKLGVEAQNGAFTFGVNYGLLAGGDDRMNNSFNANVRYTF